MERDRYPQPDFGPTQVKTPDELVVGREYIHHYQSWEQGRGWMTRTVNFTIIEMPYTNALGVLEVKVEFSNGSINTKYLKDLNIVPDKDETWFTRTDSWLEDPTKTTPTE